MSSSKLSRVGVVVHPTRDIQAPRRALLEWSHENHVEVDALALAPHDAGADPAACDLIVAIGGDGTALSAIRRAARCGRPVLGVACGSLGALTSVAAGDVTRALARFAAGEWTPRDVPALRVVTDEEMLHAFNDIALVRKGGGQLRVSARVDGALYIRLAGDGCIVSTSVGSSAYTLAARGPLLDPTLQAFVFTPLPTHGGFAPSLVMAAQSTLSLDIPHAHTGGRLEIDGQVHGSVPERLTVTLETSAACIVTYTGQETHLTGLRRRGIIADSPRIVAEDQRS